MLVVQVYVKVKEKDINSFVKASKENAKDSLCEDGVIRFDVLQNNEKPNEFMLTEIYKDENAPLEHKKTAHYKQWREYVAGMMEEPRYSVKYKNIFPESDRVE